MSAVASSPPVIPDFELLRRIGSGSYGEVWLARTLAGQYRAVKIVWRSGYAAQGLSDREFRGLRDFMAVSLEAGQLAILHVGESTAACFFYYVMELADDADLGREIEPARYRPLTVAELLRRKRRLTPAAVVQIGIELSRSLAALHQRGLVHRDVKPSNILFIGGAARLADIGLVTGSSASATFVGTHGYVPPEGPGRPAADAYALGRVLYELATGFEQADFPRLPTDFDSAADRAAVFELNEVLLRAGEPDVARRFKDAGELLQELLALQAGRSLRRRRTRRTAVIAAAVVIALVAGAGARRAWMHGRAAHAALNQRSHPPPAISDKSVAVLPLENLSADPTNAFFADGMHAELVSTLSRLPDVKVISRSSVLAFKGSTARLSDIGARLGVANVITGSVQRAGDRARILLEMRRASDEEILWSKSYDLKLADVLQTENQVADDVARVLQARALSGSYGSARLMTCDPRAYDLFLKAKDDAGYSHTRLAELEQKIGWLEEALRIDPQFMSAADLLSITHLNAFAAGGPPPRRKYHLAEAKRWAEEAERLGPGGLGAGPSAAYYTVVEIDNARALSYAESYVRALPNDAVAHYRLAMAFTSAGRQVEAERETRRALELDPLNSKYGFALVLDEWMLRRPAAENAAAADYLEHGGADARPHLAMLQYWEGGERPVDTHWMEDDDRAVWYLSGRLYSEALRLCDKRLAHPPVDAGAEADWRIMRAAALRGLGREDEAMAEGKRAVPLAERTEDPPETSHQYHRVAYAYFAAGETDRAFDEMRRWVHGMSPVNQVHGYQDRLRSLAEMAGSAGRVQECVDVLKLLLRVPTGVSVTLLERDANYDRVRGDPRFRALLADPANSQPF